MDIKYEIACRKAGLSEEKTAEISRLREYLEEFSEEDRVFLLECFSGEYDAISRISERTGISRTTLSSRKSRLIKRLQAKFQVE